LSTPWGAFSSGRWCGFPWRGPFPGEARLFLAVGVLGGFTTFSSFSYETLALLQDGEALAALAYALGSLLLGFFLAYLGYRLGGMLVA
jgi:CrcB protein